ncbi:macrolide transport system ATP-binding/permease protein [Lactobacillus colini]|uniref:Macrolide transport system ATP-binding/permease protein n=1 Tax=Lactobacillus colini TaxID=1819254 RepID=A0ABS4MCW9_9LACO|nr:ATP-binding cassette domain-containing protein [Lactobacillus colini]MBP2057531.1 macrolide transport system ATP-binding/permease protein [Lactobacillus colini]
MLNNTTINKNTVLTFNKVSLSFLNRQLFTDFTFSVSSGERVAIIGPNGIGKTTLFKLILGELKPDHGKVTSFGLANYVPQVTNEYISDEQSAGQRRLELIENTIWLPGSLLLLDEPTVYLDQNNINNLKYLLKDYDGTILLASHDMDFIDSFCTRSLILEPNKVLDYPGNYTQYQEHLKRMQQTIANFNQKQRSDMEKLHDKIQSLTQKNKEFNHHVTPLKKVTQGRYPSRSKDRIQRGLSSRLKRAQRELSHLPSEKKLYQHRVLLPRIDRKVVKKKNYQLRIAEILSPKGQVLLENTKFEFNLGESVGLLGDNGSGKTTFLKYLMNQKDMLSAVYVGLNAKITDDTLSVIDFFKNTVLSKTEIKRLLVMMDLFVDLDTKLSVLSGGELAKLALFRNLYLNQTKILLLDEPTNYLDPESVRAFSKLLEQSQLTCIIASHNEKFLKQFCKRQYRISDKKLIELR